MTVMISSSYEKDLLGRDFTQPAAPAASSTSKDAEVNAEAVLSSVKESELESEEVPQTKQQKVMEAKRQYKQRFEDW